MMNVPSPGRIEFSHHLLLEPALSLRRSVVRESASGSAGSLLSSAESYLERKPAHCRLTSAARILLLGTAPRYSCRVCAYGCSGLRSTGGFLSRSKMVWASARAVLTSSRLKVH